MFESNTQNFKSKMAGFSLPGVLVGVALMGISATIISQTVVNSRRTQKASELKLTSNKFQQAALDGVTERAKEFVLEKCSGERWGGAGTSEVEKAFRELPITNESGVTTSLKFTKSKASLDSLDGHADVRTRCENPVGPGVMGSGQYMSFCMEITPTGSPQIDYRLLELLIVPVELASDAPINCADARGAAAGVKVTWQMYNQVDNKAVSGSGKTVMKESGVFLVSMETESYSGTCKVDANRIGTSNRCEVNVQGLGRQPPTMLKNEVRVTGFDWKRGPSSNYDEFIANIQCETGVRHRFTAQSAVGSDACVSNVVAAAIPAKLYGTHLGTGWVKCAWQTQVRVNSGPWFAVGGNRFIGSKIVNISDAQGFIAPPFCNIMNVRAVGVGGGFSGACIGTVIALPGGGCGGKGASYQGGGRYSIANQDTICDGNTDIHSGIFIPESDYLYRINGIVGQGSCK
jgi:type II secretory pathway pseudopilin PulG